MADSLLSPAVGMAMCAVSGAAVAFSVAKVKKDDLCEKKIPVIGVMGAFVFAVQMINITIPATGSSGHVGGGVMLAALLGAYPALLSLSAVLIIQCLFFADGGLLALGCNIFNVGVIPCLFVYPVIFKPLLVKKITAGRISAASAAAAVVALQLGAFAVVLTTRLSGITELPFGTFLLLMQPIHLVIGIIEGFVTAAVLCFVYKMRPEIMESTFERTAVKSGASVRNVLVGFVLITLIAGGVLSLFVSPHPDGLTWSIKKITGTAEPAIKDSFIEKTTAIQDKTAFLPDYNFRGTDAESKGIAASVSGLAGGALSFTLAGVTVLIISLVKRKQKKPKNSGTNTAVSV